MIQTPPEPSAPVLELSDQDVFQAMKEIPGYLDITPGDFKEIYRLAFGHALDRINRSITAGDIMTAPVETVRADAALVEAARIMAARGISGLPVVDDEHRVIGVLSEKDFLTRMGAGEQTNFMGLLAECLAGSGCVALPVRKKIARDIMTAPAVTLPASATLREVREIMNARRINRVPVVDADGRLAGIITRSNLVNPLPFCVL